MKTKVAGSDGDGSNGRTTKKKKALPKNRMPTKSQVMSGKKGVDLPAADAPSTGGPRAKPKSAVGKAAAGERRPR